MRRMSFNSEKGAILPIVIILMLALTITGIAFLNAGVLEFRLAKKEDYKNQAFWLADGGIEHLRVKLYNGEKPASIDWTPLSEGQYMVIASYDAVPTPYAISTGQRLKGKEVLAEQKIKVRIEIEPLFDYAVFGYEGVLLTGDSIVRSTHSALGTNSSSEEPPYAIQLQGAQATVEGDVWIGPIGPGIDPESAIMSAIIAGTEQIPLDARNILSAPRPDPPVSLPSGVVSPPWPTLKVTGGKPETISGPGPHCYSSIDVSGELTIENSCDIVVEDLKITGGGRILIPDSVLPPGVTIYVTGQAALLAGESIVNMSEDPTNLHIYGTDDCTDITLAGTTDLYAAVYARKATIYCKGTSNVIGSVVGRKVEVTGTPEIIWDDRLANEGEPKVRALRDWRQIS